MLSKNKTYAKSTGWRKYSFLWGVSFLETLALVLFYILSGSKSEEHWLFNLSKMRALGVAGFLVIAGVFLWQAVFTFKNEKSELFPKKYFLIHFYSNWIAPAAALGMMTAIFYLTEAEALLPHSWLVYYPYLQPVMIWALVICAQVLFFGWLLEPAQKAAGSDLTKRVEFVCVGAMFLGLILLKIIWVLPNAYGPRIPGDEVIYFSMARQIFSRLSFVYEYHHYPPMYPVFISPAFAFSPDKVYAAVKVLNVLYSSSVVFPLFLIARRFLKARSSLIVTLLAILHPYHLVAPQLIMSENIYVPIFLWAIFFIVCAPRQRKPAWDILAGVLLGMLWLTRYITLVAVPAFLLCWWINPFEGEKSLIQPGRKKITHFLLMALSAFLVNGAWVAAGVAQGVPVADMLGFGVTRSPRPEQITLPYYVMWAEFYAGYLAMICAPILSILIFSLLRIQWKELRNLNTRWVISILLLLGTFFVAVVRHSTRAGYNFPLPHLLMGRYLIAFSPLLLITALIVFLQPMRSDRNNRRDALISLGMSSVLVVMAYLMLVEKTFPFPRVPIWSDKGASLDGAYVHIIQDAYLPFSFFLMGISTFHLMGIKAKQWCYAALCGLMFYVLCGLPEYSTLLYKEAEFARVAKSLAESVYQLDAAKHEEKMWVQVQSFPSDERSNLKKNITRTFFVYNIPQVTVSTGKPNDEQWKDTAYLFTLRTEDDSKGEFLPPPAMQTWAYKGNTYYLKVRTP